jgi:hypothetical protein
MSAIVLKGGTAVDPPAAFNRVLDVPIQQGLIANIAPAIPA